MDLDAVSRFNSGKPGLSEGRRLKADFDLGKRLWRQICEAARAKNPKCETVMLEGNHEARLKTFLETAPALTGMLEIEEHLNLHETGTTYVPCDTEGLLFRLHWTPNGIKAQTVTPDTDPEDLAKPSIAFCHGLYHNKHHGFQTISRYGWGPIYYGHVHDAQRYQTERYGKLSFEAGSLGYLGRMWAPGTGVGYTKGRPMRWSHGFASFLINPEVAWDYTCVQYRMRREGFVGRDGVRYSPRIEASGGSVA